VWVPVAVAPVALVALAVVDTVPTFDPWSLLGQAPAAAICVLFMLGKIHGPGMREDRDEARQQLADLNAKVIGEVTPALVRALDAIERNARRGDG
jgi:hypothetical protein